MLLQERIITFAKIQHYFDFTKRYGKKSGSLKDINFSHLFEQN